MNSEKEAYTTPKLTVYGTLEQITWAKTPQAGDGLGRHEPYGKLPDGYDALTGYSRS